VDYLFAYRVFIIVAETGNMTSAGNTIFLTQPAISMQIKTLEELYGRQLFSRYHTGLVLTDEGKKVYHYAKKIVLNFDGLVAELKTSLRCDHLIEQKEIKIGSCVLINELYMDRIVQSYMRSYPEIRVSCIMMDYDNIIKLLLEGSLDVGLVGKKNNTTEAHTLEFDQFLKEELGIILPRDYMNADQKEVSAQTLSIESLAEMNLVALQNECGITCLFKQLLKRYHMSIDNFKIRAAFCSPSSVKNAIVRGFGWSILPLNYVRNELNQQIVWKAELKGYRTPLKRPLFLVYKKSKEEIYAVKFFLQLVKTGILHETEPVLP